MNYTIVYAIKLLATLILGSDIFERILAAVERWDGEAVSSAEKRHGVLNELQVIGIQLSQRLARLGVELAVTLLRNRVSA